MAGVSVTYPRYFLAPCGRAATDSKFRFHDVRNVVCILNSSRQDTTPLRRFSSGILLSSIEPGTNLFPPVASVVEIDQSRCQDHHRKLGHVVLRRGSPKFSLSRTTEPSIPGPSATTRSSFSSLMEFSNQNLEPGLPLPSRNF
jgi:hypothetical protein